MDNQPQVWKTFVVLIFFIPVCFVMALIHMAFGGEDPLLPDSRFGKLTKKVLDWCECG